MTSYHETFATRFRRVTIVAGLLASVVSLTAMIASRVTETVTDLQQIEVHTKDYAFDMPTSFKAGLAQVTLVNDGKEPHHLWIFKLEQGKKLADVVVPPDVFEALKAGPANFPKWAVNVGGPNSPVPGGKSVAIIDLEPGHYAVICVIPAPDGQPHVMKGMAKEFDVTRARGVVESNI